MARHPLAGNVHGSSGRAIVNARVYVYETGTDDPVPDLYTSSSGGLPQESLLSNEQGDYLGWLDTPRSVAVKCTDNNGLAYYANTVTTTTADPTDALVAHMVDPDAHANLLDTIEVFATHPGELVVADGLVRFYFRRDCTLDEDARFSIGTVTSGAAAKFDVRQNGVTSLFATQPTIPIGQFTVVATVLEARREQVAGDFLTFHTTQIGSGDPGSDASIQMVAR